MSKQPSMTPLQYWSFLAEMLDRNRQAINELGIAACRAKWVLDKLAVIELRQRLEQHVARWCK